MRKRKSVAKKVRSKTVARKARLKGLPRNRDQSCSKGVIQSADGSLAAEPSVPKSALRREQRNTKLPG